MDPLAEKTPRWSSYHYDFDNPLRFVDPNGMESEAFSFASKSQEIAEKHGQYQAGRQAQEERNGKSKDKPNVTMTVTDEIVSTAYVYADGQIGTDHYFEVNTYKMTVSYTDAEG